MVPKLLLKNSNYVYYVCERRGMIEMRRVVVRGTLHIPIIYDINLSLVMVSVVHC